MSKERQIYWSALVLMASFLISPASQAQTGKVLLTDNYSTWAAAAGQSVLNTTSGYGTSSTGLGTGSVSYPVGTVVTVGNDWNTWCCGYTGQAIWPEGATSTTITLTGLSAFGLQIEPDIYQIEPITVTLSNGQTITDSVGGEAGAQFFGYVGSGITSITITDGIGDDFAFGNFYSAVVKDVVTINSADLVSNLIAVTLAGTPSDSGVLTITLNGASGTYSEKYSGGTAVGSGSYEVSLTRTSIPIDSYSSVTASWAAKSQSQVAPVTYTFNLPDAWEVLGVIRHSQYNVPTESSCPAELPTTAYIVNSSCEFIQTTLNPSFMAQTRLNGTGQSISFGLIKPAGITIEPKLCSKVTPPKGSNKQNTFFQVGNVTGTCKSVLTPGISQATFPNPKTASSPSPVCSDFMLLVQPSQGNLAVKTVDDYCPACSHDFRGTNGHIDNFSNNQSCRARSAKDLGNFWTTDTQGESQ